MSQRHKRGFTLVELLVVIAIIGILVALLLPAVQSAREAARRSACTNNMKQLALGCLNYESTNKQLPYARKYDIWDAYTWTQLVLPYIEQQAVHDLYWTLHQKPFRAANLTTNTYSVIGDDARRRTARETQIPTYYCPSDQSPTINEFGSNEFSFWRGNYRGCVGNGDLYGDAMPDPDFRTAAGAVPLVWGRGAFGVRHEQTIDGGVAGAETRSGTALTKPTEQVRLGQITDGTSNTLLVSEGIVPVTNLWGGALGEIVYGNMGGALFSAATTPNSSVADKPWGPCPQDVVNGEILDPSYSAPCQTRASNKPQGQAGAARGYAAARSKHSGGVNVAMADGSVAFATDDIDWYVWRAAGTRAMGESYSGISQ